MTTRLNDCGQPVRRRFRLGKFAQFLVIEHPRLLIPMRALAFVAPAISYVLSSRLVHFLARMIGYGVRVFFILKSLVKKP